jgi:hypothetical protein
MRYAANPAKHIRKLLRDHGSPDHAASVQRFFTEPVASHGWRAAELRARSWGQQSGKKCCNSFESSSDSFRIVTTRITAHTRLLRCNHET